MIEGLMITSMHKDEIIIKSQNLFMVYFMQGQTDIGQRVDYFWWNVYTLKEKGDSMFVDVHAHLIDDRFESPSKVVETANFFGVEKIISAGSNYETSLKSNEFARKTSGVYSTVGVHPEDCDEYGQVEEKLAKLAKNDKVIAIGEIGLDYHYENFDKEKQKEVFLKQIILADKLSLPVVIHSRDAMADTMEILKENKERLKHGGIFHCYSGSVEEAKEILKLGFSFSFGGVCTFKNAKKCVEVINFLPLENIMLETDCPYLSPEPHRGEINEPKNIPFIAEKIASIKGISLEDVAKITTKNAERVFKIWKNFKQRKNLDKIS